MSCGCDKVAANQSDCVDKTRLRNLTQKISSKRVRNKESGQKGVVWHKDKGKWKAQIGFRGKRIFLGYSDNVEDAIAMRREAEKIYFNPIIKKEGESGDE